MQQGKDVLYITERCVFRLTADGLELTEVAPGIDIERDILAKMAFKPIVTTPREMDRRIFRSDPMGLREDMLRLPLDARFSYDDERSILYLNFEDLQVNSMQVIEDFHVMRHLCDTEFFVTYEGTAEMQALIVGRDITSQSAFT